MIFLYRFDIKGNGIDFVLNEGIAQDMYPDCDKRLKPLVRASCETLSRYKHLSISNTIMDGNILDSGEFEVMLSKGLGKYLNEAEKDNLFMDAKKIADILVEVMNRRILDEKEPGKVKNHQSFPTGLDNMQQEMSYLGDLKWLQEELEAIMEGRPKPNVKQIGKVKLPTGIEIIRGYDHRGHCYQIIHKTLGNLGKLVLMSAGNEQQTMLISELAAGEENLCDPATGERKKLFETVIMIISGCLDKGLSGTL